MKCICLYRYRSKVSVYNERVEDLNLVTQQRDDIKKQYDDWRKKRYGLFVHIYLLYVFQSSSLTSLVLQFFVDWMSSWQDSMQYH